MRSVLIGALVLLWIGAATLGMLSLARRRQTSAPWLLLCAVLGPLSLPAVLVFAPRPAPAPLPAARVPLKIPSDEELLAGKIPFKDEVRKLREEGRLDEAAGILEVLLDEVEQRARRLDRGVPHWPYEQLAGVRRRQGRDKEERRVLERWQRFQRDEGGAPERRLRSRLQELRGIRS